MLSCLSWNWIVKPAYHFISKKNSNNGGYNIKGMEWVWVSDDCKIKISCSVGTFEKQLLSGRAITRHFGNNSRKSSRYGSKDYWYSQLGAWQFLCFSNQSASKCVFSASQTMSYLLIFTKTNISYTFSLLQIAAVLIMWNQKKGVELPYFEPQSPLTGLERKTALQLKKQYNIHEERGVDVYPEIFIISTDRDHRGKGLATEMYRRAIASVKSEGHKIVASTFTNPASRRIGQNLHFETVSRIELNDIKYDDGSLVFGRSGNKKFIVQTVLNL